MDASPVIVPPLAIKFYCRVHEHLGHVTQEFYSLGDEFRQWAAKNPDAHIRCLPEFREAANSCWTADAFSAVEYLIEGRAPTCKELIRRYDTWVCESTCNNFAEYEDVIKFALGPLQESIALEMNAEKTQDPVICRATLQKAGKILGGLLNIKEPVL